MELKIISAENKETGKQKLPTQFQEEIRVDIIKRAVETSQSNKRQPYGSDPRAGKKASAVLSRRRRKYRGSYGKGISRSPRKIMSGRGEQLNWVGAFAPNTVGGRRSFPPKSEHDFSQKINNKERKKAIRSAMAATIDKKIVQERGHKIPENYPFILSNDFEKINKTKSIVNAFKAIGLENELTRSSQKKIKAGKGALRGRKYQKTKGPLIVVSTKCEAIKAAKKIPGVDITQVTQLNAEKLAPGTHAGRLTLFTQAAIQKLEKEKLYM